MKPVTILIVNTRYTVRSAPAAECDKRSVFGWCNVERHEIFIDESLTEPKRKETLWHEIIHCLHEEYAFPSGLSEEKYTRWLGKAISEFVRANRSFVLNHLVSRVPRRTGEVGVY